MRPNDAPEAPRSRDPLPGVNAASLLSSTPQVFAEANASHLARARAAVARLKSAPPSLDTLRAWDEATGLISDASARASLLRSVHPDAAMRDAGERCEQEAEALATELSLDPAVHRPLSQVDASGEDEATRWYLFRVLRDFRRAGVDKDEPTRAKVRALNEELVRIGQEFQRNIRDDVKRIEVTREELAGLPDDYVAAHAGGVVTTDYPDYIPFMTYSRSSAARERLWRVNRQRAHPQNLEVLDRMLSRRYQLARLLGYASWAAYVTEDKMIGSDKAAGEFIEKIASAAEARAKRDYETLRGSLERVEAWDSEHLKEMVRAEKFGFDSQSVRPYFELSRVLDGVLETTARMFGIEYRRAADAPVWHADVMGYDVLEQGRAVGRFYLDLYPRDGKYKHAAQFTVASGVRGAALPEGALVCNFPRPGKLLEHSEVVTFFHEFGHLLHHIFGGHTRWAGVSGVRTEWDFVEAPSQMLEEWCWDAGVLQRFARHVETGAPIPADLVQRMRAADEFGKGLRVRQQMFYAATSLRFHDRDPKGLDSTALANELQEKYTPFRAVPGTYFQESFGHLEGYSAIYYTYMWSLVIAKDLFGAFRREGLLSPAPAARYRRAVLEPGGSRPAAELVKSFLGREPSFDAFAEWLNAS
ncbi:MAG TPA: M3 family metallopeptidase [Myxococcales bacterium]|nr:M3 family metallopeptidase [Myxococcales bacterium]